MPDAKSAPTTGAGAGKPAKPAAVVAAPPTATEVLHKSLGFIDKYVESRDRLLLMRVARYAGFVGRAAPPAARAAAVDAYVAADGGRRAALHALAAQVDAARRAQQATSAADDVTMDVAAPAPAPAAAPAATPEAAPSSGAAADAPGAAAAAAPSKLPKPGGPAAVELDAYVRLLVLTAAARARGGDGPALLAAAGAGARALAAELTAANRRTADFFGARAWAIAARAAEAAGALGALVPALLAAHRTATLRHDEYGAAVALNWLLRAAVLRSDYDAAGALLSKASFPEAVSVAQLVRFLFYSGRARAVTAEYADAHAALQAAGRKAPPGALGFRAAVAKFDALAQLLMGEVPERAAFSPPEPPLRRALAPYLALTASVRRGELRAFAAVVAAHAPRFEADGTASLVRRLEGAVIKAGLRRVAAAYSRVSFADVAARLNLETADDAEALCARAVADGIIEGVLDRGARCLLAVGAPDVYATTEPADALASRIAFCMDVHNEAVRAVRYPPKPADAALESAEKEREREREESDMLENLGDGDDDDDGMDD